MTITQSNVSTTYNMGDTINIIDLFELGAGTELSDVNFTITYDAVGETSTEVSDVPITDLENIGMSADADVNNPKIRFNGYGEYSLVFYTNTFLTTLFATRYLAVTIKVEQSAIRLVYKELPSITLATCSGECDESLYTFTLAHTSSDNGIENIFDLYTGETKITDSVMLDAIYEDLTDLSLLLKLDNILVQNGGNHVVTTEGIYQIELSSYTSSSYIFQMSQVSITVVPISYSNVRFAEPYKMEYGSLITNLHQYLTTEAEDSEEDTRLSVSDLPSTYNYTLVSIVGGFSTTIIKSNIPTTPPGMYIISLQLADDTINGLLVISKATLVVNSSVQDLYKLEDPSVILTFNDLVYMRTPGGIKKSSESVSLAITLTPADGSSVATITTPTYTLSTFGTLEIIATYSGSLYYKSARLRITSIIGSVPIDITIGKKYFITRDELNSDRIIEIEDDIVSNLVLTNRITGSILDSESDAIVRDNITVNYSDTAGANRQVVIYYTYTEGGVTNDETTVSQNSDYLRLNSLVETLSGNDGTVSIKGIRVIDGSSITLVYDYRGENFVVTLDPNDDGEVYKIDSGGSTDGITYVTILDSEDDEVEIATDELIYLQDTASNFTNIATMPNGFYKAFIVGSGLRSDEYLLNNSNISQHIVFTDTVVVELDIINYLIDRITSTDRPINYLLESPHLLNVIGGTQDDFTISKNYFTVKVSDTAIGSDYSSNMKLLPDMIYAGENLSTDNIALIPFTESTPYLDLYNGTDKLDIAPSYTLTLPPMVIDEVEYDMNTWFTDNNITLNDPSSIMTSETLSQDVIDDISDNITTVVTNYDDLEMIVIDESSINSARSFWINQLDKFTYLKSTLDTTIRGDPGSYLTNQDIENAYPGESISTYDYGVLDLSDFDENDLAALEQVSDVYDTLVYNEINTLVLKRQLVISMLLVKYDHFRSLGFKYQTVTNNIEVESFDETGFTLIPDTFSGSYGTISMVITVTVTNEKTDYGSVPGTHNATRYTYSDHPSTLSVTYTNSEDVVSSVTFDKVSEDNQTVIYKTPSNITIKGANGLTFPGWTRWETFQRYRSSGNPRTPESYTSNHYERDSYVEGSILAVMTQYP